MARKTNSQDLTDSTQSGSHDAILDQVPEAGFDIGGPFIVAIGASAGGLEALEAFFNALAPTDILSCVVIQHLSPDFRSLMDEILSRQTTMTIYRVEDGMEILPGCIYLIPPKKEMTIRGSRLHLTDKDGHKSMEMPIDIFLRSLARERGRKGVAVILSGSGSDGSRGIADVRRAGGLVLVQNPQSAKFDGMPRKALDTGEAHLSMLPEEMPEAILEYCMSPESFIDSARHLSLDGRAEGRHEAAFLDLLRQQSGIDFSCYKPTTVGRRVARRMAMHQVKRLSDYLDMLNADVQELGSLSRDLLIGVTSFFRDTEAFERLENDVLPGIFSGREQENDVRVWVAGCATGEEAYSLAMLLTEAREKAGAACRIIVFATDVHRESIEFAAVGLYERPRLENVSRERLERFFSPDGPDSFRVIPEIRSMVVFAPHNMLSDPPFTRIDLISCRNMLIYFLPAAQEKAVSMFHFALKVGAVMFMGMSETPGALSAEFDTIDPKCKMYRKRRDVRLNFDIRMHSQEKQRFTAGPARSMVNIDRNLLRDYDLLLSRYMPPGLIVGERREILHIFGDVSRYLALLDGRIERDVLEMVDSDLRLALSSALHRSAMKEPRVHFRQIRLQHGEGDEWVDVGVERLTDEKTGVHHYHISFEQSVTQSELPASTAFGAQAYTREEDAWQRIIELEGELQTSRENLQATIEELQTTNEELQATNEEMLAANEELQSTNEELHSVNEELYTVNAEFEKKNKELLELNDDHDNLLRSTEVGTLFLDRNLRIRKFNPAITRSFRLLPQDVGRPVDHIAYQFGGQAEMLAEMREVLSSGNAVEREIAFGEGQHILRRTLPFVNSANEIKGVVLTFTDISQVRSADEDRHQARLLRELASHVPGMVFQYVDPSSGTGSFSFFSEATKDVLRGVSAVENGEKVSMSVISCAEDVPGFETAMRVALESDGVMDHEFRARVSSGPERWVHLRSRPRKMPDGGVIWNGVCVDITALKDSEAKKERAANFYLSVLDRAPALIWRSGPDGSCNWFNDTWLEFTGRKLEEVSGEGWTEGVHPEDLEMRMSTYRRAFSRRDHYEVEYRLRRRDGQYRWIADYGRPFEDMDGRFGGYFGFCHDITERRKTSEELAKALGKAENASRSKGEFLANMSHEIRTPLNGVMGMLHLLQMSELNADQTEFLNLGMKSCERLTQLISDILDQSRIEAGKMAIRLAPFSLADTFEHLRTLFAPIAFKNNLELNLDVDTRIPGLLMGDATRLLQVLGNLVGNSLKFTQRGGVTTRAVLDGEADSGHIRVRFEVSDSGIGIPDDELGELFQPFTQLEGGMSRKHQGAGLGLSICRQLVELMGGGISIESVAGTGTSVRFWLPLEPLDDKSREDGLEASTESPFRPKGRILVVDDDGPSRLLMKKLLQKLGCSVTQAEDGSQALEHLARRRFDCVFMDVQMPVMDGLETLKALRGGKAGRRNAETPVIAVSAYALKEDRTRFLAEGMDDYIVKPVDSSLLESALRRFLDSRTEESG